MILIKLHRKPAEYYLYTANVATKRRAASMMKKRYRLSRTTKKISMMKKTPSRIAGTKTW